MGELRVVKDFLPSPDQLVLKEDNVKVTISLSKSSINFFKNEAKKHRTSYQKMIRRVIDFYASQYQKNVWFFFIISQICTAWEVQNSGFSTFLLFACWRELYFLSTASNVLLSKHEIKNNDRASTRFSFAFFSVSPWECTSRMGQVAKNHFARLVILKGSWRLNNTSAVIFFSFLDFDYNCFPVNIVK